MIIKIIYIILYSNFTDYNNIFYIIKFGLDYKVIYRVGQK